jgi:hypothetical protein
MTNEQIMTLARDISNVTIPMQDAMQSAIACLRHTHDRLIDYPEFETLRLTINAEIRALLKAGARP